MRKILVEVVICVSISLGAGGGLSAEDATDAKLNPVTGLGTVGLKSGTTEQAKEKLIIIEGKKYKVLEMADEVKPEDVLYDIEVKFVETMAEDEINKKIQSYGYTIAHQDLKHNSYMLKLSDGKTNDLENKEIWDDNAVDYYEINPFKGKKALYIEKRLTVIFRDGLKEKEIKRIVKDKGTKILKKEDGEYRLEIEGKATVPETVNKYRLDDRVIYATPEWVGILNKSSEDPEVAKQWYLEDRSDRDIDITGAWDLMSSTREVTVAIIDSGVDYSNKELAGQLIRSAYSDDNDIYGHGTEVAGIIGAETNNGKGISGICWNGKKMVVKILPIKVTDTGYIWMTDLLKGLRKALKEKPEIINMSLSMKNNQDLREMIKEIQKEGIVIICSSGIDGKDIGELKNNPDSWIYPGTYEGVINVGSLDRDGNRSKFSNYGESVDVYAPGEAIYTTTIYNGYKEAHGTSFSAAIVTGIAVLMKSEDPLLTAEQIKTILKETQKNGIVNAKNAVERVKKLKKEKEKSMQNLDTTITKQEDNVTSLMGSSEIGAFIDSSQEAELFKMWDKKYKKSSREKLDYIYDKPLFGNKKTIYPKLVIIDKGVNNRSFIQGIRFINKIGEIEKEYLSKNFRQAVRITKNRALIWINKRVGDTDTFEVSIMDNEGVFLKSFNMQDVCYCLSLDLKYMIGFNNYDTGFAVINIYNEKGIIKKIKSEPPGWDADISWGSDYFAVVVVQQHLGKLIVIDIRGDEMWTKNIDGGAWGSYVKITKKDTIEVITAGKKLYSFNKNGDLLKEEQASYDVEKKIIDKTRE